MVNRRPKPPGREHDRMPVRADALRGGAVLRHPHRPGLLALLPAAGRDAVPGPAGADPYRRAISAGLTPADDSILGQARKFTIRLRRPPPDHHRDRVQRNVSTCPSSSTPSSSIPAPKPPVDQAPTESPGAFAGLRRRPRRHAAPPRRGGVDVAGSSWSSPPCSSAAKLLGELAERLGQPAVLGELVAGVLLGGSSSASFPPGVEAELIHVLAELGVVLLLFEIGLETDLKEMFRVGPAAAGGGAGRRRRYPSRSATCTGSTCRIRCRATRRSGDRGDFRRRDAHRHLGGHHRPGALRSRADEHAGGADHHRRRGNRRRPRPGDPERGLRCRRGRQRHACSASLRTLAVAVGFLVVAVLVGRFSCPGSSTSSSGCGSATCCSSSRWRSRSALPPWRAGRLGAHHRGVRGRPHSVGHEPVRHHRARGAARGLDLHADLLRERRRVGRSRACWIPASPAAAGILASPVRSRSSPSSARSRPDGPRPGRDSPAGGRASAWCRAARSVSSSPTSAGARACSASEVFGAVLLMVMVTTFVAPPALKALFGRGRSEGADDLDHALRRFAPRRRPWRGAGRPGPSCSPTACSICSILATCELLEAARREGDALVVGLNSDASVRRLGRAPSVRWCRRRRGPGCSPRSRRWIASCCSMSDTPLELIQALEPDVLVKGADYPAAISSGPTGSRPAAAGSCGCRSLAGFSTTALVERLRAPS